MSPVASLSLDLDNKWSFLKTHGDESWRSFPSYLSLVVPTVLSFADEGDLTMTVFVVGQDAELDVNAEALGQLGRSRHEIGNHSFYHEPWLHLKSKREIEAEISRATEAIVAATGKRPLGFRGPGFSLSQPTIEVLAKSGYQYDATTLPTWIGPLARAFYFKSATMGSDEMEKRDRLFGSFGDVLQPIKPYQWMVPGTTRLLEIPVTTMPFLRVPIHATYLLYLAQYAESLSRAYLNSAIRLCRLTGTDLSFLLHPLDFLGGDDVDELSFFPGMSMRGDTKRRLVGEYLEAIRSSFDMVPMSDHADMISLRNLRSRPAARLAPQS